LLRALNYYMAVDQPPSHRQTYWPALRTLLLEGRHKPQLVGHLDIPKPDGGMRQLGIPTVVDRLTQQAILQVLETEAGFFS